MSRAARYDDARPVSSNDAMFLRQPRDHWSLAENYFRLHSVAMPEPLSEDIRWVKREWEAKHGR